MPAGGRASSSALPLPDQRGGSVCAPNPASALARAPNCVAGCGGDYDKYGAVLCPPAFGKSGVLPPTPLQWAGAIPRLGPFGEQIMGRFGHQLRHGAVAFGGKTSWAGRRTLRGKRAVTRLVPAQRGSSVPSMAAWCHDIMGSCIHDPTARSYSRRTKTLVKEKHEAAAKFRDVIASWHHGIMSSWLS